MLYIKTMSHYDCMFNKNESRERNSQRLIRQKLDMEIWKKIYFNVQNA